MASERVPLLDHGGREEEGGGGKKVIGSYRSGSGSSPSTFSTTQADIQPIRGVSSFFSHFGIESKKLWYLAGPAIFTSLCRYSLGAVTQLAAGQLGTLPLAAVSVENSVIAGFSFGVMLGMGSALETLCGQAYGAGQLDMLGIYMQRSWVILNSTAVLLCLLYVFAGAYLKAIGQAEQIAEAAGTFALYMIPQLFLRHELPDRQVPASAEQDHGHGGHRLRRSAAPLLLHLAPHAQAPVGVGRRRRGAQLVVVVHRGGAAALRIWR